MRIDNFGITFIRKDLLVKDLTLLVVTGKCNTLGYATLGLGLAPKILLFLINKALK